MRLVENEPMKGKRRSSTPRAAGAGARAPGATTAPPPGRASKIPTSKPHQARTLLVPRLHQLVADGDLDNALALAEALLRASADAEIDAVAARCRAELDRRFLSRLGPLNRVVVLHVPPSRWLDLDLDPRECFLLAHVDDVSTLQTIVDVSGMPKHDALRVLCSLLDRGLIGVR